jgi:hypothetical protein
MENNITAQNVINQAKYLSDKLSGVEFPIRVLPLKIQEIARVTSECLGFPLDFISASLCFAISVAIGNTHSVKIKEGWSERALVFITLVAPSGSNKSAPLSFAMQPLLNHDFKESQNFKKLFKEYQSTISLTRKDREEQGIFKLPDEPIQKRLVVSDVTPESLATIHEQNKRGICLYVDELKSWINNFNRYNTGSSEQLWLSVFSCKPIIIDRRSLTNSVSIKRSFIGVIGSIQYGLLKDLAKGDRSDSGFLDRILFVIPRDLSKKYWSLKELPSHIIPLWNNMLNDLLKLDCAVDQNNDPVPLELPFEDQAKKRLYEWQKHNTDLCNKEPNKRLVGMYSKLEIYAIRFCLLIQISRWVCEEADKEYIDLQSVENAIELTEYFRSSAKNVQLILNTTTVLENMTSDKVKLYEALPSDFTTAEGTKIAESLSFTKDGFNRFLNEAKNGLLDNYRHGRYKKYI